MLFNTYRTRRSYVPFVDVSRSLEEAVPERSKSRALEKSYVRLLHAWRYPPVTRFKKFLSWAGWVIAAIQGVLSQLPQ